MFFHIPFGTACVSCGKTNCDLRAGGHRARNQLDRNIEPLSKTIPRHCLQSTCTQCFVIIDAREARECRLTVDFYAKRLSCGIPEIIGGRCGIRHNLSRRLHIFRRQAERNFSAVTVESGQAEQLCGDFTAELDIGIGREIDRGCAIHLYGQIDDTDIALTVLCGKAYRNDIARFLRAVVKGCRNIQRFAEGIDRARYAKQFGADRIALLNPRNRLIIRDFRQTVYLYILNLLFRNIAGRIDGLNDDRNQISGSIVLFFDKYSNFCRLVKAIQTVRREQFCIQRIGEIEVILSGIVFQRGRAVNLDVRNRLGCGFAVTRRHQADCYCRTGDEFGTCRYCNLNLFSVRVEADSIKQRSIQDIIDADSRLCFVILQIVEIICDPLCIQCEIRIWHRGRIVRLRIRLVKIPACECIAVSCRHILRQIQTRTV